MVKFSSIEGAFEQRVVTGKEADLFYFDKDRRTSFPPPASSFIEESTIEDPYWFFQLKPRYAASSSAYIAVIRNCFVLPSGAIVLADGSLLLESLYPAEPKDYIAENKVSRNAADAAAWRSIILGGGSTEGIRTIKRATHCREFGESGYFHWVASVLPRLSLVLANFRGETGDFLIQNHSAFARDWTRLLLPPDASVLYNDSPVFVEELIYPGPAQTGNSHYTRNPWLFQNFRNFVQRRGLLNSADSSFGDKLIYVSRSDAPVRKLTNEQELIEALKPLGFTNHVLTGRSAQEQIDIFSAARIVISPHGAGLTNLLFCNQGVEVIELMSVTRSWPGFKVIARACELNYHSFISSQYDAAHSAGIGLGNEDFKVSVKSCVRFIESCMPAVQS